MLRYNKRFENFSGFTKIRIEQSKRVVYLNVKNTTNRNNPL